MKSATTSQNPARGIIVTVPEMARFLGCSSKHIRELIECGAPIHERGGRAGGNPHKLNSFDFLQWRDAWRDTQKLGRPKSDGNSAVDNFKEKLNAIKIQRAELELKKAAGTLIDFRELGPFIQDKLLGFRQALCAIPAEMREEFGNEAGSFCDALVTKVLNNLARGMDGAEAHAREIAKPR